MGDSLKQDAVRLIQALEDTVLNLKQYAKNSGLVYPGELAQQLTPCAKELKSAVIDRRSRDDSYEILKDMQPLLRSIFQAAGRGEMDFDKHGALQQVSVLSTIFQEVRYRNEAL